MNRWRLRANGFALPTILLSSVVMMMVLLAGIQVAVSIRVALDNQRYNALAREASESGVAHAQECLRMNNYTPQWSDAKPLTPSTDCSGNIRAGCSSSSCYILNDGRIRTSYSISAPIVEPITATVRFVVNGQTSIGRTSSPSTVVKTYDYSLGSVARQSDLPQISAGAGWREDGHIGFVLGVNGRLYGFGDNSTGTITGAAGGQVLDPRAVALPAGVLTVKKVVTSGQGAAGVCILGSNNQVYCRGNAGFGSQNWQRFNIPTGETVVDLSVHGFGTDGLCVVTNTGAVWCAGENYYGTLGAGNTSQANIPITSPTRWRPTATSNGAGAVIPIKKIYAQGWVVCGITTIDDLYCSGINNGGQLTGPSTGGTTGSGVYAWPIRYNIPAGRKVKDVITTYHNVSPTLHVLAVDGTLWCSGWYGYGDCGNGTTAGSTGTSQTPVLFNGNYNSMGPYATTSILHHNGSTNGCIDNQNNSDAPGNPINIWNCNGGVAQQWIMDESGRISVLGNGGCMQAAAGSPRLIELRVCSNSTSQQFIRKQESAASSTIRYAANTNLCLDAPGAIGTRLRLSSCSKAYSNNTAGGNGTQNFTYYEGLIGWQKMLSGTYHFCAYRPDMWSGMWCAGDNNYGQLANYVNSSGNSFLGPCQANPSGNYWAFNVNLPGALKVDGSKITDESNHQFLTTFVIGVDGQVYGAGRDQFGMMGNGTLGDSANDYRRCTTVRFQLPSGVSAVALSARDEYSLYVLGDNGRIYATGRNNVGQLGDGTTTQRLTPTQVRMPYESILY